MLVLTWVLSALVPIAPTALQNTLPRYDTRPVEGFADDGRAGRLHYRGGFEVVFDRDERDRPKWGGVSAVHVDDDGRRFLMLSDENEWWSGELAYNEDGHLVGLSEATLASGKIGFPGGRNEQSAESICRVGSTLYLTAEPRGQLWMDPPGPLGRPTRVPGHRDWSKLRSNSGLEALTALADDRLLVIAELPVDGGFNAWLGDPTVGAAWTRLRLPTTRLHVHDSHHYRPSAADTLPNGDVVLLEREHRNDTNFLRIARIPLAGVAGDDYTSKIEGSRVVLFDSEADTGFGALDNFEGIAAWEHEGEERILLVSDDNLHKFGPQNAYVLLFAIDRSWNEPVRVLSDFASPPFIWESDGKRDGRDFRMMKLVAEHIGRPIEWTKVAFSELLPAIEEGKGDLVCATLGITEGRKERVAFSQPYFETGIAVVVRSNDTDRALDTLGTVAAAAGTTAVAAAKEHLPNAKLVDVAEAEYAAALRQGRIDAAVMDELPAQRLAKSGDFVARRIADQPFGLVFHRENHALRRAVDNALTVLRKDGDLASLDERLAEFAPPPGHSVGSK